MSFKMYNQNFQQAYYGANLYSSYFWNAAETKTNVLTLISNNTDTQDKIYDDIQFGMNSNKAMVIWIAAYLEFTGVQTGWYHSPQQILIDHFDALNVEITMAELAATFANGGIFATQVGMLETKLIASKYFKN